jgi:uncharacterized protein YyaL (SSP411 family)
VPQPTAGANELLHEASPYLRQHAFNPVQWRAWKPATLRLAVEQQKPIFLSSGYSTCHWCHVMQHESFEDAGVAALLNAHFVPIKLDREERPDVDGVYMTFLQATEGHGGWPLSIFLAPDLTPLMAGTYYPRDTFVELLRGVARFWKDPKGREEGLAASRSVMRQLQAQAAKPAPPDDEGGGSGGASSAGAAAGQPVQSAMASMLAALTGRGSASASGGASHGAVGAGAPNAWLYALAADACKSTLMALTQRFDRRNGGFGAAPKFPRPTELQFLALAAAQLGARAAAAARPAASAPTTHAAVPFMITRAMREELARAGFTADQVRAMTPADAHAALQRAQGGGGGGGGASAAASTGGNRQQTQDSWVHAVGRLVTATQLAPDALLALPPGTTPAGAALGRLWFSLRRMAAGGVHDLVGGGFHRYSTDARWHVPHFEKMTYDQAAIVKALADAYLLTGDAALASAGIGVSCSLARGRAWR